MIEESYITLKLVAQTFQMVVFSWYITYTLITQGIQNTVSKTYYKLPDKKKIYFTFFIWGISLPMFVFCFNPVKPFLIASTVLIAFVGGFVMYKQKITGTVHIICAGGGIGTALMSLACNYDSFHIVFLYLIAIVLIKKYIKHPTYYIEVSAFLIIILSIAFKTYSF